MENILKSIKDCILAGNYRFTEKAQNEMQFDNLSYIDILESIVNAQFITKKIKSTNPTTKEKEVLYIIKSFCYSGLLIYTKGKLKKLKNKTIFYILISSKKGTD